MLKHTEYVLYKRQKLPQRKQMLQCTIKCWYSARHMK